MATGRRTIGGMRPLSCEALRGYLDVKEEVEPPLMVLDCRPFLAFNEGHISAASNAYCPSILRRRYQGAKDRPLPLRVLLSSAELRDRLHHARTAPVVLYDEAGNEGDDSIVRTLSTSLEQEAGIKNLFLLEGGFQRFRSLYPHLCVGTSTSNTIHPPARSFSSASLLSSSSNSSSSSSSSVFSGSSMNHTNSLESLPSSCRTSSSSSASSAYWSPSAKSCPSYEQGDPVEILPFLYLGSAAQAGNQASLQRLGINALMNVSRSGPPLITDRGGPVLAYKSIPVDDSCSADIGQWFQEAIAFIDSIRPYGKVLVHCHAGISRSATICLAYLMSACRLRLEEAYEYVKRRRNVIAPNFSFMGQLLKFESQLFPATTAVCRNPPSPVISPSHLASNKCSSVQCTAAALNRYKTEPVSPPYASRRLKSTGSQNGTGPKLSSVEIGNGGVLKPYTRGSGTGCPQCRSSSPTYRIPRSGSLGSNLPCPRSSPLEGRVSLTPPALPLSAASFHTPLLSPRSASSSPMLSAVMASAKSCVFANQRFIFDIGISSNSLSPTDSNYASCLSSISPLHSTATPILSPS